MPVHNKEIAEEFRRPADLLEIGEVNLFRVRLSVSVGKDPGSKLDDAKNEENVEILDEGEFEDLLNQDRT